MWLRVAVTLAGYAEARTAAMPGPRRVAYHRIVAPPTYARLTRLALGALTAIVITGAAVRLTGSGLGCSDWPTCENDSLIAPLEYHALVEFVNRLFTGVVAVAVIAAVLGSWRRRPRRRDLIIWSGGLVAGVLGQVLLGALLVRTHLDPRFVMGHFLLSMVLLWNATVLDLKARSTRLDSLGAAAQAYAAEARGEEFRSGEAEASGGAQLDLRSRLVLHAVLAVGAAVLVTGTIVTGAGPHAGDTRAERLPLLVREVTRIHSIVAIALLALTVWAWLRLRAAHPGRARELRLVALLLTVQGAVGYTQYFSGVPALLVGVHVTLASAAWIAIVRATHLGVTAGLTAAQPQGVGSPGLAVQVSAP